MINLLPTEEKKKIRRDYALRLLTMVLIAVSAVAIIGIVSLFPSFFIADFAKRAAVERVDLITKENGGGDKENITVVLRDAQQKLEILSPESEKVSVRTVFDTAIDHKSNAVTLTGLVYQQETDESGETLKLIINGVADRREDLLAFSQKLEQDEMFDEVELPVSNLAQDRNISFTLTVVSTL